MRKGKFNIFLLAILIVAQTHYEIPSYYGFWSKRFYQPKAILEGQFAVFQMHFAIDLNFNRTLAYFADESQHCILKYDLQTQVYGVLAGDKIGNAQNALFNSPSSIAYFMPDSQRSLNASNSKVYLTVNQTCSLQNPDCILDDVKLQTLEQQLSLQNIRINPPINLYSINPHHQIEYIYITDKMNHCIKRITLHTQFTEVVAGFCGEAGFLDGPLGFNRINKPSNIGVDAQGNVYFFDEGNQYMRKVNLQNSVQTLLNGACTQCNYQLIQDKRTNELNRIVKGFELKKMICYSNWIQKKTGAPIQHYYNQDLLNICTLHSSKCPS